MFLDYNMATYTGEQWVTGEACFSLAGLSGSGIPQYAGTARPRTFLASCKPPKGLTIKDFTLTPVK